MRKLIRLNIQEERHELTKLLRLDMFEMKRSHTTYVINYYEGRMLGMVAAYLQLGIIDYLAHKRYIDIIVDTAWKLEREKAKNEV